MILSFSAIVTVVTENKTETENCHQLQRNFPVSHFVFQWLQKKLILLVKLFSISPVDPPEVIMQVIFPRVWISL
jgi:hypothetical protein